MGRLPLEGLRIADFTWVWAGPHVTWLLAEMGAEVIKIESFVKLDQHRRYTLLPADSERGLALKGWFVISNRGKLSVSLDITKPKGLEIAKKIISVSDAVTENFTPRVMKKLGLGYPMLKEIKPDIIMVSLSGYGNGGPRSDWPAYGDALYQWSGLGGLTGRPGGPSVTDWYGYSDPSGGKAAAFALLAALHCRDKTGKGQHVDISQTESITGFIPDALMEFILNGAEPDRMANRDYLMAPHGLYRCKGDDEWASIAIATEQEWKNFCNVIGNPGWTEEKRFCDRASRWENQDDLDKLIEQWTAKYTKFEVTEMLQKAGVAGMASNSNKDLLYDPHLKARGFFVQDHDPEVGEIFLQTPGWKLSAHSDQVHRPAPMLGEHNEYVLEGILGMSREEIQHLEEENVVYTQSKPIPFDKAFKRK